MNRRLKKRLMLGVAVVAVIAGATAAVVMAAQPSARHHRTTALAVAASYLGVSQTRLRGELRSGKSLARIANATSGKSAAGLIALLEASQRQRLAAASASLAQRVKAEVERPRGAPTRSKSMQAAAGYLGVTAVQLRAEQHSGKSLAQIAEATSGRSAAGLLDALVAAKRHAIDAALKAGVIKQAQANTLLSRLLARMTARVHRG
jgi:hypothetical protein